MSASPALQPSSRAARRARAQGNLHGLKHMGGLHFAASHIVAPFCVQVRKIAIRVRMTAITAMALLVSVTNVRYICS